MLKAPTDLPAEALNIWTIAFSESMESGDSEITALKIAWAAVRRVFKKTKKGWVKAKSAAKPEDIKVCDDSQLIVFEDKYLFENNEIVSLQFCAVGDNVTNEELNDFIKNFDADTYGQKIFLQVGHPYFREGNFDTKSYGEILKIYRKGSAEGWIDVKLNWPGATVFNDRLYNYLSPGWFPKYQDPLTKETFENVLFEVSLTNIPAEKWMSSILDRAASLDDIEEIKFREQNITKEVNSMDEKDLKIKELEKQLSDVKAKAAESDKAEVKRLSEEKKTAEQRALEAEKKAAEAQKAAEEKEKRLKALEAERQEVKLLEMVNSLLPQEGKDVFFIKSDQKDKVLDFMRKFGNEAAEEFTAIVKAMPGTKINASLKGTRYVHTREAEPKEEELTEAEKSNKALEKAKADPGWADPEKREALYDRFFAELGGDV